MAKSTKNNGTNPDPDAPSPNDSPQTRSARKKKRPSASAAAHDDDGSVASVSSVASRTRRKSLKRKKDETSDDEISMSIGRRKRKKDEADLEAVTEDAAVDEEGREKDGKVSSEAKRGRKKKEEETSQDVEMEQHEDEEEKKGDENQDRANGDEDRYKPAAEAAVPTRQQPSPKASTFAMQRLRLPSQQTPKPPPAPYDLETPSVVPGGRRLLFETAKKKENKFLLGLRGQQEMEGQQDGVPTGRLGTGEEAVGPPGAQRTAPVSSDGKTSLIYFFRWMALLLSVFVAVNVSAALGESGHDIPLLSWLDVVKNAELASAENIGSVVNTTIVESGDEDEQSETQQVIENIVKLVDPSKLRKAKAEMQLQRKEEYELNRVNLEIEQAEKDLKLLNALIFNISSTSPDLVKMLSPATFDASSLGGDVNGFNSMMEILQLKNVETQNLLAKWEEALNSAEGAMDLLVEGEVHPDQMNQVLNDLSTASLIGAPARVLDTTKITIPGEPCKNKDYVTPIPTEEDTTREEVEVVGGIDVEALDIASDAPVRSEDAQAAVVSLMKYAHSTAKGLIGQGPTSQVMNWIQHWIDGEWRKEGLDKPVEDAFEPLSAAKRNVPTETGNAYTTLDALNDIDRLLEIESADRTGIVDRASVIYGARVLRRGPYATSPSLYESLPLMNRILAYSSLRFYGHPPEAALRPSSMYGRGQCWSFVEERRKSSSGGESRGDYGTLTVSLSSPTMVTEVVVEHLPTGGNDMMSAVNNFRVLGFEDGGAFGEPYELGSFQYDTDISKGKFSMQRFSIPTVLNGVPVPKLKAITLAVDSNWGADFTCLYRFRVHGS